MQSRCFDLHHLWRRSHWGCPPWQSWAACQLRPVILVSDSLVASVALEVLEACPDHLVWGHLAWEEDDKSLQASP